MDDWRRNTEPFDKKEMTRLVIVTVVSGVLLLIGILLQALWLGIPAGIVLYVCLWLFFSNFIAKLKSKK